MEVSISTKEYFISNNSIISVRKNLEQQQQSYWRYQRQQQHTVTKKNQYNMPYKGKQWKKLVGKWLISRVKSSHLRNKMCQMTLILWWYQSITGQIRVFKRIWLIRKLLSIRKKSSKIKHISFFIKRETRKE